MVEHVSRFHMMRRLSGELSASASERVDKHVQGCGACRGSLAQLRATQSEPVPSLELTARGSAPSPLWRFAAGNGRRLGWGLGAVAACAAVAIVSSPDRVRKKGTFAVKAFCKAPDRSLPTSCHSGDVVSAGTRIQFEAKLQSELHVMVIGRDEVGPPTVYFPDGGKTARARVVVGGEFMNASIQLDSTPGTEAFVIFGSRRPFAAADVLGALDDASAVPTHISSVKFTFKKRTSQSAGFKRGENE